MLIFLLDGNNSAILIFNILIYNYINKKGESMSTRSSIIWKLNYGGTVITYHHSDGYLEGVGQDLVDKLEQLKLDKNSTEDVETFLNKVVKDPKDDSYRICDYITEDVEYIYYIKNFDYSVSIEIAKNKKFLNEEYFNEDTEELVKNILRDFDFRDVPTCLKNGVEI
jgi:hypothetical protein